MPSFFLGSHDPYLGGKASIIVLVQIWSFWYLENSNCFGLLEILKSTGNFTSYNTGDIVSIENVREGVLFFNFCNKKAFIEKMIFVKMHFAMQNKLK